MPPIVLWGLAEWEGAKVFKTALASPYPVQLCSAYGRLIAEPLDLLAAAEQVRQPIPMTEKVTDMGLLRSSTWLELRPSPSLELADLSDSLVPNSDGQSFRLTDSVGDHGT